MALADPAGRGFHAPWLPLCGTQRSSSNNQQQQQQHTLDKMRLQSTSAAGRAHRPARKKKPVVLLMAPRSQVRILQATSCAIHGSASSCAPKRAPSCQWDAALAAAAASATTKPRALLQEQEEEHVHRDLYSRCGAAPAAAGCGRSDRTQPRPCKLRRPNSVRNCSAACSPCTWYRGRARCWCKEPLTPCVQQRVPRITTNAALHSVGGA